MRPMRLDFYKDRRILMSEPRYLQGDDYALGINQPCESCDEVDCVCEDPDRLHDERGAE